MSKIDKEYQIRMQGMIYALNLAKKEGIEALEKDIRNRNILKAPMNITEKQMDEFYSTMSANVYNRMLTVVVATLNDCFGYGEKRLKDFKKQFDEKTLVMSTLDKFGDNYATFTDYAIELNKKYNLGINIPVVMAVDDTIFKDIFDKRDEQRVAIIQLLKDNKYKKSAEFLEKWFSEG